MCSAYNNVIFHGRIYQYILRCELVYLFCVINKGRSRETCTLVRRETTKQLAATEIIVWRSLSKIRDHNTDSACGVCVTRTHAHSKTSSLSDLIWLIVLSIEKTTTKWSMICQFFARERMLNVVTVRMADERNEMKRFFEKHQATENEKYAIHIYIYFFNILPQ